MRATATRKTTPTLALAATLLALGLSGCGGSSGDSGVATAGGTASATASSGAGGQSGATAALQYARCMRANGVPNFPDPTTKDGNFQIMLPQGVDPQAAKAAGDKCKQYLPNGGAMDKPDPQFLAKMRAYAVCMRAHGVPGFPDPNPNGGMVLDPSKIGMKPDDPRFQSADQACASSRPSGTVHSGGPGGLAGGGTGGNS